MIHVHVLEFDELRLQLILETIGMHLIILIQWYKYFLFLSILVDYCLLISLNDLIIFVDPFNRYSLHLVLDIYLRHQLLLISGFSMVLDDIGYGHMSLATLTHDRFLNLNLFWLLIFTLKLIIWIILIIYLILHLIIDQNGLEVLLPIFTLDHDVLNLILVNILNILHLKSILLLLLQDLCKHVFISFDHLHILLSVWIKHYLRFWNLLLNLLILRLENWGCIGFRFLWFLNFCWLASFMFKILDLLLKLLTVSLV